MAKKRGRGGPRASALESAAAQAAGVLAGKVRVRGRRREHQTDLRGYEMYPGELDRVGARKREPIQALSRRPRALRLFLQRDATRRALAGSNKGLGRVRRERAVRMLPQALVEAICADRKRRREVMFASGAAGKGRRKAARNNRQASIWSMVRC